MGVRPPQDDADEPESLAFGIAALAEHLDRAGVSYPIDSATLVRTLDDPEIPCDPAGNGLALSTALERTGQERFDSEEELLDALHPVFEKHRRSASVGLLGRLRSLF
ncbi:hypothetical protein [Halococcus sp. AFM35]|uniref:hypothetical protein n=1 Tax=Halococcus sp. AFM35 TaxID=3421653 RepID=UPI003EB6D7AA